MAVQVQLKRNFKARSLRPWRYIKKGRGDSIKQSNKNSSRVHCVQTPYRVLEGSEKLSKSVPSFKEVQSGQFQCTEEERARSNKVGAQERCQPCVQRFKAGWGAGWHLRL